MKQEYRHTKPIRGKDPTFEKEGLDWTKESLVDNLIEYIYHECGKGNWPTREGVDKIVSKKKMILPAVNKYEKLILRCYLKNIVTVSSLSKRLVTIMERLDKKQINSLAFSVTS